jgi:hypothetical protein
MHDNSTIKFSKKNDWRMQCLNLPKKLTTTTTKHTMGLKIVSTKHKDGVWNTFWRIISVQIQYQEGRLNQEVINALEDSKDWNWKEIHYNIVAGALFHMQESGNFIQTDENSTKQEKVDEEEALWYMLTMRIAYHDGKLSQEQIKEVEEQYEGLWNWKTIPTNIVVEAMNTINENRKFKNPICRDTITPA